MGLSDPDIDYNIVFMVSVSSSISGSEIVFVRVEPQNDTAKKSFQ